jgi:hypothetical protein
MLLEIPPPVLVSIYFILHHRRLERIQHREILKPKPGLYLTITLCRSQHGGAFELERRIRKAFDLLPYASRNRYNIREDDAVFSGLSVQFVVAGAHADVDHFAAGLAVAFDVGE